MCIGDEKPRATHTFGLHLRLDVDGPGLPRKPESAREDAVCGKAAVDAIEYLLGQGADSLVIDVRNNPGGLPGEVAVLLDYLLPAGRLFSEVNKKGVVSVTESDSLNLQMPTCVLINTGTFGEAELCAAVLKEYQRAVLMGESTSGSTRSQETIPLADGSANSLSTRS